MPKPYPISQYQGSIILLLFFLLIIILKTIYYNYGYKYLFAIHLVSSNETKTLHTRYYTKCGKSAQQHNPATIHALQELNIQYSSNPTRACLYIPCGYNYLESELSILEPSNSHQVIFAIKGADQLCSKNQLWHRIHQRWGRDRASQLTPETWVILNQPDIQAFYDLPPHDHQHSIFILKKNIQRKQGLKLVHGVPAAISAIEQDHAFRVIQRYIPHPLCIKDRKLNIRLYICIVCPGKSEQPIEWWLHPKGKCIYTADKYTALSTDNLDNHNQHLTSFNLNPEQTYTHDGLPETLGQFRQYIGSTIYKKIWLDIISVLSGIRQSYTQPIHQNYTHNSDGTPKMCFIDSALQGHRCFQLFGLDVIIDTRTPTYQIYNSNYVNGDKYNSVVGGKYGGDDGDNWQPLVLEFNKGPEMSYKSPEDKNMKTEVMTDCIKLGLDKDIRKWTQIP